MVYQSDRNVISLVKNMGIKITWTFILLGYKSDTPFSGMLSASEIWEYAIALMENGCDCELVVKLAITYQDAFSEMESILKILSAEEENDIDLEIDKWKVVFLSLNLGIKEDEYINGLCHLAEIWQKVGTKAEKAELLQGVGNTIEPKSYYTRANYEAIYNKSVSFCDILHKKVLIRQVTK